MQNLRLIKCKEHDPSTVQKFITFHDCRHVFNIVWNFYKNLFTPILFIQTFQGSIDYISNNTPVLIKEFIEMWLK